MKAALINQYGGTEVFKYGEVEKPQFSPEQILVKVHFSSVNPIDWKIRQGMLKIITGNKFPMILGFDLAGEVVEIGSNVTRFKVGDAVFAALDGTIGRSYAEYVAISEKIVAGKPKNMSYEEAAAVPLAAMTALQVLRDKGQLKPGQTVLINGASGGVGIFAVQIAKALGAGQVTGVCSGKNSELVKSLGADRVIDYKQQNFLEESIKYDIIFDVVGNLSFSDCKKVLPPNGIYITTQPFPANLLQSFITSLLPGPKYKIIMVQPSGSDLAYLKEQIEQGKIRAVIDRVYPLSEIAAAHAYSATGRATGKVVIKLEEVSM